MALLPLRLKRQTVCQMRAGKYCFFLMKYRWTWPASEIFCQSFLFSNEVKTLTPNIEKHGVDVGE
jgi:hypothetical protein